MPEQPGRRTEYRDWRRLSLRAAAERRQVAVMVAAFSPPDVRQVRMTGPARLEDGDEGRVRRIYERYVPAWTPAWEKQTTSPGYRLWAMSPERGMAVAYPGLAGGPVFSWTEPAAFAALRN